MADLRNIKEARLAAWVNDEAFSARQAVKELADELISELHTQMEAMAPAKQTWYTLEQAWKMKYAGVAGEQGAIAYSTIRNDRSLQPRGGVPDAYSSNRAVWTYITIKEWLMVDDDGLEAYLAIHNPRRAVSARLTKGLRKRNGKSGQSMRPRSTPRT